MRKIFCICFIVFFWASMSLAQFKDFENLSDLYSKSQYENCIEKCQKAQEKEPKEPMPFLYDAFSNFGLFLSTSENALQEKLLKNCLKSLKTVKNIDKKRIVFEKFPKEISRIKDSTKSIAQRLYYQKKEEKSKPYYDYLVKVFNDTTDEYKHLNGLVGENTVTQATLRKAGIDLKKMNQTDELGRKQGAWKKVYPNGNVAYEARFRDDKNIGEYKRYDERGNLQSLIVYDELGNYGKATFYDDRGNIVSDGFFKGQKKDSLWRYYSFNKNIMQLEGEIKGLQMINKSNLNYLVQEERYKDGVLQGLSKRYYPGGNISELFYYENNKIQGIFKSFFPSGKLKEEIHYKDGKRNGKYLLMYENGNTDTQGNYENDLQKGEWQYFDMNKKSIQKITYKKGKAINQDQIDDKQTDELKDMDKRKNLYKDPEKYKDNPMNIINE